MLHFALVCSECRRQDDLGVGSEHLAIHCAIDDHGSGQSVQAQPGDQRGGLPVTMGHAGPAAFAAGRASTQAGHLGRRAGFIEKDQLRGIEIGLELEPGLTASRYVLALLLAGMRGLFL